MTLRQLNETDYKRELKIILKKVLPYALDDCVYLLDFGEVDSKHYYKFGKTSNALDRMKTHFRRHQFYGVVGIWKCPGTVETELRRHANSAGTLCTYMGESEIICSDDIQTVVDFMNSVTSTITDSETDETDETDEPDKIEETTKTTTIVETTVKYSKFACQMCSKKFRDNTNLAKHMKRKKPCVVEITPDTIYSPTRCTNCNKTFSRIGNLNKHRKSCKVKPAGNNLVDSLKHDIAMLQKRIERL